MVTLRANIQIGRIWEGWYPFLAGACAFGLAFRYGEEFARMSSMRGWQLGAIYSGVFNLSAVLTGFTGTYYGVVVSANLSFLNRIRRSPHYAVYMANLRAALRLGFCITIATFPFLVLEPTELSEARRLLPVAIWFGLFIWTLAAFFRVATSFFIILDENVEPRSGAG